MSDLIEQRQAGIRADRDDRRKRALDKAFLAFAEFHAEDIAEAITCGNVSPGLKRLWQQERDSVLAQID